MTKTCTTEGCDAPTLAKGLCRNHYYRLRRKGYLLTRRERGDLVGQQRCSVAGCEKAAGHRGGSGQPEFLCNTHYRKISRSGTLDRLVYGDAWRERQHEAQRTPLSRLDPTPDPGKGRRGFLAVNMVNEIKQKALKRGKDWLLQPEEAYALIVGACRYCGAASGWPESRNGIDRVDNADCYTVANSVSCCETCNSAKGTKTVDEFAAWVGRAHAHLSLQKGN